MFFSSIETLQQKKISTKTNRKFELVFSKGLLIFRLLWMSCRYKIQSKCSQMEIEITVFVPFLRVKVVKYTWIAIEISHLMKSVYFDFYRQHSRLLKTNMLLYTVEKAGKALTKLWWKLYILMAGLRNLPAKWLQTTLKPSGVGIKVRFCSVQVKLVSVMINHFKVTQLW